MTLRIIGFNRIFLATVLCCASCPFLWAQTWEGSSPSSRPIQPPPPKLRELPGGPDLPASSALPLSEEEVYELSEDLPLEQQRYLIYLYARLNQTKMAERLGERILAEDPTDKPTLLALASMYVEQRHPRKASQFAKTLVRHYPDDPQSRYFLAAAHYVAGRYGEAYKIFRRLKGEFPEGRYPYETDLASSAYQAGRWNEAMQSYQTLLRQGQLEGELRDEVRLTLDNIYRAHLPQAAANFSSQWLNQGRISRAEATYSHPVQNHHRLRFEFYRDVMDWDQDPSLRSGEAHREEGLAAWTTVHSQLWESELRLGGSGSGPVYGGELIRRYGRNRNLSIEYEGNRRAFDSLLLEALDGRQDRLSLGWNHSLASDLLLRMEPFGRRVHWGQETFGWGYGLNATVEKVLFWQAPELRVGYQSFLSNFSATGDEPPGLESISRTGTSRETLRAVTRGLIQSHLHRQGVYVAVQDHLADAWKYRSSAGAFYSFDLGSVEYEARAGLSFFPRKSIELALDAGYSSVAGTSDQFSELIELTGSLKYYF